MRLGVLGARADQRGLAYQTYAYCKWLNPSRALGIDMTADDLSPYPTDWSPYEQLGIDLSVMSPKRLREGLVRSWAKGLDVVLAAETFYNEDVVLWLRDEGVRTVCHINPELCGYYVSNDPRPDVIANPTTWRMRYMPGAVHLPMPVDRELFPFRLRESAEHFVHVAGHKAMGDRAGSRLVLGAMGRRSRPQTIGNWRLTLRTQSPLPWSARETGRFTIEAGNVADPRDLYADADVLVHPRRYGGNDLVANEALSLGIPIIALHREPEKDWGGVFTIRTRARSKLRMKGGHIETYDSNPLALLQAMDKLVAEPHLVKQLSIEADAYAESISWTRMQPVYMDFLEGVARGETRVLCRD